MILEITGKLIEKYETQKVSEKFRKREFVLELIEEVNGSQYTNYAKMQLVQSKCDILDGFNVGDTLRVNFNIKGNRYEKEGRTSYFSNLDAWRLEKADMNATQSQGGGNYAGNMNNGGYNSNSGGNWGNSNNNSGFPNSSSNATVQSNTTADSADDLPF